MTKALHISGVHSKVSPEVAEYARRKIGPLDKYAPRHAAPSMHTEVKLKEDHAKDKLSCTCEVIMHLPHATLTVHEKATTMLAAIDTAEDKLKIQLKKYKDKHAVPRLHRRLAARLRRKT